MVTIAKVCKSVMNPLARLIAYHNTQRAEREPSEGGFAHLFEEANEDEED